MFKNRRIVVCIPSGREKYLRILLPFLLSDRSKIVDEVQLWVNTNVPKDLAYLQSVGTKFAPKVKNVANDGLIVRGTYDIVRSNFLFADSVCHFYRKTIEPNTIYVKLDDDMCWIHPDFFENLCADLLLVENRCFFVSANVMNIATSSKIYQDMGVLGVDAGISTGDARCPVACIDGKFAKYLHERFLELYAANETEKLYFTSYEATGRHRIGAIAYTGETFARFGGCVESADEKDLTQVISRRFGMPMRTCGNALICHFASAHQRALLEDETDILDRYLAIATKETGITC